MSDDLEPQQFFVKTDAGKVMGPLTFTTIELLAASGAFGTRCQCSIDGLNFAWPARFPDLFEAFPEEMRGPSGGGPPITRDAAPPPAPRGPPAAPRGAPPVMAPVGGATPASGPRPAVSVPQAAPAMPSSGPRPAVSVPPPAAAATPASGPRPAVAAPAAPRPATPAMPTAAPRPAAAPKPPGPPRVVEVVPVGAPLPELISGGPIRGGAPFRLYYLIAAQSLAGELRLQTPAGQTFTLHFKKGACELAKSDEPSLSLVDFLQKKGALKPAQAQQAEAAKAQFGGEVVNALFALGLINPAEAFPLLGEHGKLVLERALQVDGGHFIWNDKAPSPAMTIPLVGNKWGPLCDAGRKLDRNLVGRRLGDQIDCPVMKAGDGLAKLEDLRLNAQETRVVGTFDGTRSLAELAAANPPDAELVYRTAYFLGEVGFASFANGTRPRPEGTPVFGEAPKAEPPAAPPAPALDADFGLSFDDGLDLSEPAPPVAPPLAPPPASVTPRPQPAVVIPPPAAPPPPAPKPAAVTPSARPAVAPPKPAAPPVAAPRPPAVTPAARPAVAAPPPAVAPKTPPPAAAPKTPPPATAPRPVVAPKPAAPPVPVDAASLKAHLAKIKKQDLFEVLGVKRDANAAVTKAAFFTQAKLYHPDMSGADATAEVRTLREDITARLNEAFATLSDDYQRGEYLASLELGGASREDVINILNAEESFQLGAIMVKARRFQDGLAKLEEAISFNPKEGEFYAWRAFARFTLAADKRAAKAAADVDLQKCLQLNPKCASAWLFQARMLVVVGDSAGGTKAYRKCLELDEKNSDAERELKALERMGK